MLPQAHNAYIVRSMLTSLDTLGIAITVSP